MENRGVFPHRGFILEITGDKRYSRISDMFMADFGPRITRRCVFKDPAGSLFNIRMVRDMDSDNFIDGIASLRAHYRLQRGGWLNLYYLGASEFYLKAFDRDMKEVDYQKLPRVVQEVGWDDFHYEPNKYSGPNDLSEDFINEDSFYLKKSHLTSNHKSVPVSLVRKVILPHKPDRCVLRDEIGRRYYCDMHWAKRSGSTCSISGGWTEFVETNDLAQGDRLCMGIELKDCTVIHIEVLQRVERSKNARGSPAV